MAGPLHTLVQMPTAARLLAVLVATALSLASVGPGGSDIPPSDLCQGGVAQGATALELGGEGDGTFRALSERAVVEPVIGGQGTDMIPLRYKVSGTSASCLAAVTRVYRCEPQGAECSDSAGSAVLIAEVSRSLASYPEADGVATRTDLVILDGSAGGGLMLIEAEVAGARASRHISFSELPDAGVDAMSPDAATADAPSGP